MNSRSIWERYYIKTPLEKIPWQKSQANYFTKVIETGKVKSGSALDLGCGTGAKSIYLAKRGFKVNGVDISRTAIKFAKRNAQKAKVKARFIVANATDLGFLKNKKFDFILDWANLHGIPKSKRKKYIQEIVKHTKKGGKLLLRCFSKRGVKKESVLFGDGQNLSVFKKKILKIFLVSIL
ncbi:unnamed protein product, partial [marine sediment metagenome]